MSPEHATAQLRLLGVDQLAKGRVVADGVVVRIALGLVATARVELDGLGQCRDR